MNKITHLALGLAMLYPFASQAQEESIQNTPETNQYWNLSRPDGHAPIGISGDHLHHKGDWMFSYKMMPMSMEGMLLGEESIDDNMVPMNPMNIPQEMTMNMHMLGIMHAPSDNLTLMIMMNYLSNEMSLVHRMGMMSMDFETESSGLGDLSVGALIRIFEKNRNSIHGNISVSIPTGDIDQRGDTPMMSNAQLAYPMQLGSGTFDPTIGLTYLGQSNSFSWGSQAIYKFRLGDNEEEYHLGDEFKWSTWTSIKGSNSFAFSASINYRYLGTISGQDKDMNPMMMPLFNTENSGRDQIDFGIGTNYFIPDGLLKNLRLGLEVNLPVYQKVVGVQMENKVFGTIGLQYALGASCH